MASKVLIRKLSASPGAPFGCQVRDAPHRQMCRRSEREFRQILVTCDRLGEPLSLRLVQATRARS